MFVGEGIYILQNSLSLSLYIYMYTITLSLRPESSQVHFLPEKHPWLVVDVGEV